jgi:hypothetical protein
MAGEWVMDDWILGPDPSILPYALRIAGSVCRVDRQRADTRCLSGDSVFQKRGVFLENADSLIVVGYRSSALVCSRSWLGCSPVCPMSRRMKETLRNPKL